MIYHSNTKHKKAGVTVLPDKTDFKTKSISRDREGDLIIIKGPLNQEDKIILNMDIINNRASKYGMTELQK